MKGIILAGGRNQRLYPLTKVVSKHLLPVYDKPMIYYPMSVLMKVDIRDILIISTPEDLPLYQKLFKDGKQLGIKIEYCQQDKPEGLAHALILAEEFIAEEDVCLVLGDNLFLGDSINKILDKAILNNNGATVFGKRVTNPEGFGVIEVEGDKLVSITEKPTNFKSNIALTGIYIYDNNVIEYAKKLKPSLRNELEISDLNNMYLSNNRLDLMMLDSVDWFDCGTVESLTVASDYIRDSEQTSGRKTSVIEEIAYNKGWIKKEQVLKTAKELINSEYGKYLKNLIFQ